MYKCLECGLIFEEPDAYREPRGEFWGMPCYETLYRCPNCHEDNYRELIDEDEEEE